MPKRSRLLARAPDDPLFVAGTDDVGQSALRIRGIVQDNAAYESGGRKQGSDSGMMDNSLNTTKMRDKAESSTDSIAGSIERAADNPVGRMAQGVSESNERHDAREPMNSLMRTMLLSGAGMAIVASLSMQMMGRKHEALFFGQWAPTLLTIALWYQLVKGQQGHTRSAYRDHGTSGVSGY